MPEDISKTQDSELSALGFSKQARRNLVVAIMAVQFTAIGVLWRQTNILAQRIDDIRSAQVDSSNAQYARLVDQVARRMEQ